MVVGGGLAGLVAARRLAEAGLDVRVIEQRNEVGGRVRTRHVDGFTLDRGFQVLFTAYPAVRRELALDALDLRYFEPGATIARPGSRSVLSDPFRDPGTALASFLNREVTSTDKLRLLRLRRALRKRSPERIFPGRSQSIETYLRERGFSRAFLAHFAAPFYGGITLDRSLSTAAAVFEYTFKMLSEGRIAVPSAGMAAIPAQLARRAREAGARIETGVEASAVGASDGAGSATAGTIRSGATIELEDGMASADAVVVATDPPTARDLTGVESIPTDGRGCVSQYYSLPAAAAPDTGARLVLNATDDQPNHVAPMSAVAPEYAPSGASLLAATFLGRPDATDAELADSSRSTLSSWYPEAEFEELDVVHTERVAFAQFDQPPGVHAGLPSPGEPDGPVYLAGDFTRWSSIQGAIESGARAADAVLGAST